MKIGPWAALIFSIYQTKFEPKHISPTLHQNTLDGLDDKLVEKRSTET